MNTRLDQAAKDLTQELKSKIGCYLVVGWSKDPDTLILYIDEDATYPINIGSIIPNKYRGFPVDVQLIKPPSIRIS
jgi:hypothetical protein